MEPPLISHPARTRLRPSGRCSQAGRGSPQAPINRHAPLILNRQGSREKLTTFGLRQSLLRLNVIAIPNGYLRHVPAPTAPGPLWPTQSQRQRRFARLRRLSLALLLSALPVTGAGGASFRVRVWAFSAMRG